MPVVLTVIPLRFDVNWEAQITGRSFYFRRWVPDRGKGGGPAVKIRNQYSTVFEYPAAVQ